MNTNFKHEIDILFYRFLEEVFMLRGVDYDDAEDVAAVRNYLGNFDIQDGFDDGLAEYDT